MLQGTEVQLVRAALDELLAWDELERSTQLADFLRYIVEAAIRGDEQKIKAYSIAVDVFGRPSSFDPQADPIVRVQGGRLRILLDRFYAEHRNKVPLRIRMPVGRYVPKFESAPILPPNLPNTPAESPDISPEDGSTLWRALAAGMAGMVFALGGIKTIRRRLSYVGAVIVFAGVLVWTALAVWTPGFDGAGNVNARVPEMPVVSIGTFANLTGIAGLNAPIGGLPLQLVTDLSRFDEISVRQHEDGLGKNPKAAGEAYELSGVVRRGNYGLEFNMLLLDGFSRDVVWTTTITEPVLASDYPLLIGHVSRLTSGILGSYRGPLHLPARLWAQAHAGEEIAVSEYICVLLFSLARDEQDPVLANAAQRCFSGLLEQAPNSGIALAGWAGLEARAALDNALPGENMAERLFEATQAARQARDLVPQSGFVRAQLASVLTAQGEIEEARREYAAAVQRNPADVDVRAEFALMLAFGGEWQIGMAQMELVLADSPVPPPWHYALRALNSLREKKYDIAITNALIVARTDGELGPVVGLSAAAYAGRDDLVTRLGAIVRLNPRFQAQGIVPLLQRRIRDQTVLATIAAGLGLAGIDRKLVASAGDGR